MKFIDFAHETKRLFSEPPLLPKREKSSIACHFHSSMQRKSVTINFSFNSKSHKRAHFQSPPSVRILDRGFPRPSECKHGPISAACPAKVVPLVFGTETLFGRRVSHSNPADPLANSAKQHPYTPSSYADIPPRRSCLRYPLYEYNFIPYSATVRTRTVHVHVHVCVHNAHMLPGNERVKYATRAR